MASPLHRTAALILTLTLGSITLGAAGWVACAAEQTTSQVASCPMHEASNPGAAALQTVSQSAPLDCCTASGAGTSTPATSGFLLPVSSAIAPAPSASATLIAIPPSPVCRIDVPLPPGPVARHILLSVFLI